MTTRYHLLHHSLPRVVPLVAIHRHSLYRLLSLIATRCITRLSFYKGSLIKVLLL